MSQALPTPTFLPTVAAVPGRRTPNMQGMGNTPTAAVGNGQPPPSLAASVAGGSRRSLIPPDSCIRYRVLGPRTVLHDVLRDREWEEGVDEDDWHFIWADPTWVVENMNERGGLLSEASLPRIDSANGWMGLESSVGGSASATDGYSSYTAAGGKVGAGGNNNNNVNTSVITTTSNAAGGGSAQNPAQQFKHVNHFLGSEEITRHDLAVRSFRRMRKALEKAGMLEEAAAMDFFLPTFALPSDWTAFEQEFKRCGNAANTSSTNGGGGGGGGGLTNNSFTNNTMASSNNLNAMASAGGAASSGLVPTSTSTMHSNPWIMKPPPRTLGKGAFLFSKMSQIHEWRRDYRFKAAQQEMVAAAAAAAAAEAAANNGAAAGAGGPNSVVGPGGSTSTPGVGNGAASNSAASTSSNGITINVAASNGRGQAAAAKAAEASRIDPPHIVQKYVDSPHLIAGKKYDVCVYVAVTDFTSPTPQDGGGGGMPNSAAGGEGSGDDLGGTHTTTTGSARREGGGAAAYNPYGSSYGDPATNPQGLTIWIHRSGYARVCSHRFDMNTNDLNDTGGHFSNALPQKTTPRYSPQTGCKWALRSLRQYICATMGEPASHALFAEIQLVIIRALQSIHRLIPCEDVAHRSRSELFAFSFIIQHLYNVNTQEHVLKPLLVGVDNTPTMTAETSAEYHLRYNVLMDYLDVIDLEDERDHEEIRVGGFDMVWRNGPAGITMSDPNATTFHSFIGCTNELEVPIGRMALPQKVASGNVERSLT